MSCSKFNWVHRHFCIKPYWFCAWFSVMYLGKSLFSQSAFRFALCVQFSSIIQFQTTLPYWFLLCLLEHFIYCIFTLLSLANCFHITKVDSNPCCVIQTWSLICFRLVKWWIDCLFICLFILCLFLFIYLFWFLILFLV